MKVRWSWNNLKDLAWDCCRSLLVLVGCSACLAFILVIAFQLYRIHWILMFVWFAFTSKALGKIKRLLQVFLWKLIGRRDLDYSDAWEDIR